MVEGQVHLFRWVLDHLHLRTNGDDEIRFLLRYSTIPSIDSTIHVIDIVVVCTQEIILTLIPIDGQVLQLEEAIHRCETSLPFSTINEVLSP
jgi:hypothetical protein